MPVNSTCLECGRTFSHHPYRKAVYCSVACLNAARSHGRSIRRPKQPETVCPICKMPFRSASSLKPRIYCSRVCAWTAQRRDASDRFWQLVERTSDCWLWKGTLNRRTHYGKFWLNGRTVSAHRAAYELAIGPVPSGLLVLHHCDVRACVRPDHLFLGTQRDNMQDMSAKGRGRNQKAPKAVP